MTQHCATCGKLVGADTLLSESGEPICQACSEKAELAHGDARAQRAIFASSGGALGLGLLACFFDPFFLPSIAGIAAGFTTLGLLTRNQDHRIRLGMRAWVAAFLALGGMVLCLVGPFAGLALQALLRQQADERAAGGAIDVVPEVETEAPPDPVRDLFVVELPGWVEALDADVAGIVRAPPRDVASTHAAVLTAVDATEPTLHASFATFLDDAERFSRREDGTDDLALTGSLVALDDALAAADVPYYVDAVLLPRMGRYRVLCSSYHVARRRRFASGERVVNGLDLERVDTLTFERSLLGYTRPEVHHALVLVSRVEDFLVEQALPSIHSVDESVIVRGYEDEQDVSWVTPFEQSVHEDLAREEREVVTERALRDLAAAVVRRRIAIDAMTHALLSSGLRIREPRTLAYDTNLLAPYARAAGPAVLGEVRAAQRELDQASTVAAYEALERAHLASIARHEAQHRIDYEDDRIALHVPDRLAVYTGRTEAEDQVNELAERSNAELSAYLSQVAREPARVLTNLVHVISFPMSRHDWSRPESYAALVIFEVLAHELGIGHEDFVRDGRVVRAELAHVYASIRGHTGPAIADAATRGWASLYGVPLPPLEELAD